MAMNFVTFNQDYSYLAVATSKGFRIFTTDPFAKSYETKEGNIAIIEMLFSTSLVALILSPRRLQITNTKTSPNPNAICALSPSSDNCYLAYPLPQKAPPSSFNPPSHTPPGTTHVSPTSGEVLIFDTLKLEAINVIEAHRSPLACITLNSDGTLLATASDKGTIIRVFSVPDGHKLYQFRRGSMPSRIFSMSFNTTSTLLCVSSSTETIHLFKLSHPTSSPDTSPSSPVGRDRSLSQSSSGYSPDRGDLTGDVGSSDFPARKHNGTLMGMIRRTSQNVGSTVAAKVGGYLPKGVSEMWEPTRDFAWFKLPKPNQTSGGSGNNGPLRSVVAMSSNTPQVMVVTSDGNFYVFSIDLSKGGEDFERDIDSFYRVLESNDRLGYSVTDY
ncbi:protein-vacuolar targeting protein Atg18, putative [Aspergillus fumigatus Z5]|nr:protein-vacuolar targeting protein Atg18, putative [Aspergillus fumigatus Z5]